MAADKKTIIKMAYIYFQEGRWDKALEEYRKLLELDPNDVATQSMVADVYDKKGETRLALHGYLKVLDSYTKAGAPDKALVIRKKIALLRPDSFDNEEKKRHAVVKMTLEADRAFERGDVDQALPLFEQLAKLDQDNLQARSQLADLYSKKGMVDDAVRELMTVGLACAKGRLLNRAQECFQRVLGYKPEHHEARGHLAEIYLRRGSENEAKKEFLTLAQALVDQGDVDRAIPPAQKALQLKSIEAHYVLGLIYFKRGNLAEAERSFQEILRFKVGHISALVNLAQVKAAQGDLDGALAGMGRAVSAEPENPSHLEGLAEFYVKKGSNKDAAGSYLQAVDLYLKQRLLDKAQELLQKAIGVDPQDKAARQRLVEVLAQRGMKPEASKVLEQLGDMLAAAKAGKPAHDAYIKAHELDPGNRSAAGKAAALVAASAAPKIAPPTPAVLTAPKAPPPAQAAPPSAPALSQPVLENPFRVGSPPAPAPPVVLAAPAVPAPKMAPINQDVIRWTTMADIYAEKGLLDEALANYQKAQQADPQDTEIAAKAAKVVQELTRKAQEEARTQAEAEVRQKIEEDQKKAAQAEARRFAEEDIRKREEAKRKAEEEEVRRRAEADARRYAEEAAKKKATEEAQKAREADEARKKAEDQARKHAEEMVRRREDEGRKKSEEAARLKAESEKQRQTDAEHEARQSEALARKLQEEADKKRSPPPSVQALRPAPFQGARTTETDEESGRKAEALAAKKLLEENKKKAQEEDRKKDLAQKKGPPLVPARAASPPAAGVAGDDLDDDEYMTVSVAEIYRRRGQLSKSEKILTKILEKTPNHVEARRKLDELLAIKRRLRPMALKPPGSPPTPPAAAEPSPPSSPVTPVPGLPPSVSAPPRQKKSRISYV